MARPERFAAGRSSSPAAPAGSAAPSARASRRGRGVAVLDVDQPSVDETASAIRATYGVTAAAHVVDVRDRRAVRRGHAPRSTPTLGGPHVLVSLAGGSLGTPRDTADIEPADLDLVVDVNVKGTFYCCQAAVPYLSDGGGAIVTTSSIGGRQPSPVTGVPYAAAKAAIVGLTKRLAREVGRRGRARQRRRAGAVPHRSTAGRCSTRCRTPSATRCSTRSRSHRLPELREVGRPDLVPRSTEASYITGVVLDVNGGRFMPL